MGGTAVAADCGTLVGAAVGGTDVGGGVVGAAQAASKIIKTKSTDRLRKGRDERIVETPLQIVWGSGRW